MRLNEVSDGAVVQVVDLDAPDTLRERLLGLGFVPGQTVVVGETAPLGDPRVYIVGRKVVTLREAEARRVEIKPVDFIPLAMANPGRYVVVALSGGHRFRQRMANLGLQEGITIEVSYNRGAISLLVESGGRVVIGRGQAKRILVKAIGGATR
ncbi:MAG: FeoA domain-containing protein [Thermotogae bacterium]|nr:FeoA domain-containing protein [Thermotogota bacterium]